jgi:hypothetical protein
MSVSRVIISLVLVLLVPAQAMAAAGFNVSGRGLNFGDVELEVSSFSGGFLGLIGVMRRSDCGAVGAPLDRTPFTGTAYINGR